MLIILFIYLLLILFQMFIIFFMYILIFNFINNLFYYYYLFIYLQNIRLYTSKTNLRLKNYNQCNDIKFKLIILIYIFI